MSRLLVVEDDSSVRNTVVTFLELEGYEVDAVSSTREALQRLPQNSYPIVLSDIYMDERTGLDVLQAAKNANPDCAVILMTGTRHDGNRDARPPKAAPSITSPSPSNSTECSRR